MRALRVSLEWTEGMVDSKGRKIATAAESKKVSQKNGESKMEQNPGAPGEWGAIPYQFTKWIVVL